MSLTRTVIQIVSKHTTLLSTAVPTFRGSTSHIGRHFSCRTTALEQPPVGSQANAMSSSSSAAPAPSATPRSASAQGSPVTTNVLTVLITCPPSHSALLAETLVSQRVAACVNRLPNISSTYRWEGAVTVDTEDLLIAKTTRETYEALEKAVLAAHPYDVPEIIALNVERGSDAYLGWVRDNVGEARS